MGVRFVVDTIPHNAILLPRRYTGPDRENELTIEGFLQEFEHFVAFGSIRKEGCSAGSVELDPVFLSATHFVVDYDGSSLGVAVAVRILLDGPGHLAFRLIAHHNPEDREAHGAPDPPVIADQPPEASDVQNMAAFQLDDVLVLVLFQLLLVVPVLEFELADAALVVVGLQALQLELKSRVVRVLHDFQELFVFGGFFLL